MSRETRFLAAPALVVLAVTTGCDVDVASQEQRSPGVALASQLPACRLSSEHAAAVADAAGRALEGARRERRLPFERVAVNPPAMRFGELGVFLVNDARAADTDSAGCVRADAKHIGEVDRWTVRGVCEVTSGTEIRCSADSLAKLIEGDPGSGPSPALFLVLAHEIAHLARGHVASFASDAAVIDTSWDPERRLQALRMACFVDAGARKMEDDADRDAAEQARLAFGKAPYSEPALGAAASRAQLAGRIAASFEALRASPQAGAENDDKRATPCDVMTQRQGLLRLPPMGGSHRLIPRRLERLMAALKAAGGEAEAPRLPAEHPGAAVGNLAALVEQMGDVQRVIEGQDATALELDRARFCEDLQALLSSLDGPDCPRDETGEHSLIALEREDHGALAKAGGPFFMVVSKRYVLFDDEKDPEGAVARLTKARDELARDLTKRGAGAFLLRFDEPFSSYYRDFGDRRTAFGNGSLL